MHVGAQLLDADVTLGQRGGDLRDDARVVDSEELELEVLRLSLDRLVRPLDDHLQALVVQLHEPGHQ